MLDIYFLYDTMLEKLMQENPAFKNVQLKKIKDEKIICDFCSGFYSYNYGNKLPENR